jgi:hypothetical protein
LAASLDGTVKDSLYYRDGRWLKEKRWVTDVVLDGALTWASTDGTGYKRMSASISPSGVANIGLISKYDGKIIKFNGTPSAADEFSNTGTSIFIALADTDTGFGETYTPTAAEIANFMNGWKMSDSAFAAYSTGTKYWTAVDSPKADFSGKVSGSTVENANIAEDIRRNYFTST